MEKKTLVLNVPDRLLGYRIRCTGLEEYMSRRWSKKGVTLDVRRQIIKDVRSFPRTSAEPQHPHRLFPGHLALSPPSPLHEIRYYVK